MEDDTLDLFAEIRLMIDEVNAILQQCKTDSIEILYDAKVMVRYFVNQGVETDSCVVSHKGDRGQFSDDTNLTLPPLQADIDELQVCLVWLCNGIDQLGRTRELAKRRFEEMGDTELQRERQPRREAERKNRDEKGDQTVEKKVDLFILNSEIDSCIFFLKKEDSPLLLILGLYIYKF